MRARALFRSAVVLMAASGLTVAIAGPSGASTPKPSVLATGLLRTRDLAPVLAATPTPTTAPGDPQTTPFSDVFTQFCGSAFGPAATDYRAGVGDAFDGSYPTATAPTWNFSYTTDNVYDFRNVTAAVHYLAHFQAATAACSTYTASNGTNYAIDRDVHATSAGEDAVLAVGLATFQSGDRRSDIFSLVRVGHLVNDEYVQISDAPVQSQINRIQGAQASLTSRVAKLVGK